MDAFFRCNEQKKTTIELINHIEIDNDNNNRVRPRSFSFISAFRALIMRIFILNQTDYMLTLQYTSGERVATYQVELANTLLGSKKNYTRMTAAFDEIFAVLRVVLFGLIVLIALIYSIPIIFNRQFHHRNNILTLNFCIATILCCLYWFVFYIMLKIDLYGTFIFLLNSCMFVFVVPPILTVQIPYSFVTVSIHRLCCVVYYRKNLFKTKKWISICILTQWVLGTVSMLPILFGIESVRNFVCKLFLFLMSFYLVLHYSSLG